MSEGLVTIDKIEVGERHRKDLGDLGPLVESIDEVGLLHPIVITDAFELVAGQRRLEACRKLGWLDIPVRVLPLTPAELLRAEHDENVVRLDFRPTEKVAIGRAIEEEEARQARERQTQGGYGKFPQPPEQSGTTRDIVGGKVGWSGHTYQRAKAVVEAAESEPDTFGDLAEQMDETGKIAPAYQELRRREILRGAEVRQPSAERAKQIRTLADRGYRASQIAEEIGIGEPHVRNLAREHDITLPDAVIGKTMRVDSHRIIFETVNGLEGTRIALDQIRWDTLDLDSSEVEYWVASLNDSLAALRKLTKRLKEAAQ